jgi:hypothetical protein
MFKLPTPPPTTIPHPPHTRARHNLFISILLAPHVLPLIIAHVEDKRTLLFVSKQFNRLVSPHYYPPFFRAMELHTVNTRIALRAFKSAIETGVSGLSKMLKTDVLEFQTAGRNQVSQELVDFLEAMACVKLPYVMELTVQPWVQQITIRKGTLVSVRIMDGTRYPVSRFKHWLKYFTTRIPGLKLSLPHLDISQPALAEICSSRRLTDALLPLCTIEISRTSGLQSKLWILNKIKVSTISIWLWGDSDPLDKIQPQHVRGRHLEVNLDVNEDSRVHTAFKNLMLGLGDGGLSNLTIHTFADAGSITVWQLLLYQHRNVFPRTVSLYVHYDTDDYDEEYKEQVLDAFEKQMIGPYDLIDHPATGAYQFLIHIPCLTGRQSDIRSYFKPMLPRRKKRKIPTFQLRLRSI